MDLLRNVKHKRSFVSDLLYLVLNVGLAVAVLVIVRTTDTLWLAFVLVLLSKWRVLAVRPRYWFANIQANIVDIIVSLGVVSIMASLSSDEPMRLILQIAITIAYIAWLLLLKPRSRRKSVVMQAGVAMVVGVTALFMQAYQWPVSVAVIAMWLIGYSTARHILSHYEEDHVLFLSLLWGTFMAELGWVAYHWTIAYSLVFLGDNKLPQISVTSLAVGLVVYKAYDSYAHHGSIRTQDILPPLLFAIALVAIIAILFNAVKVGTI